MYVRFPLSFRNVENLLFQRGIGECHEAMRLRWNRFGPPFARDIRRYRVSRMKGYHCWCRNVDAVFGKVNIRSNSLWRGFDCKGESVVNYVTEKRDDKGGSEVLAQGDASTRPIGDKWQLG